MRTFVPEQIAVGKHKILSAVLYNDSWLFVLTRGKKIQLAQIPEEVVVISGEKGLGLLEIREGGGYKVPIWRDGTAEELEEIDNYIGSGSTPR